MGMILSSLPNPQQQIESLRRELLSKDRDLREAEEALRHERAKNAAIERGVKELRSVLGPLYGALQHVFGEIQSMDVSDQEISQQASKGIDSRVKAIWDDWKNKLSTQDAKAIDALLLHGTMNQVQLRIHVGCAKGSVPGIVFRLNKAGLINKNGGKISLKEL